MSTLAQRVPLPQIGSQRFEIGKPIGFSRLGDSLECFIRHRDPAHYGTDTTIPDLMKAARKHHVALNKPEPARNAFGVHQGVHWMFCQPNDAFLRNMHDLGFPTPRTRTISRVDFAVDIHYRTREEAVASLPAWRLGIVQKWNRQPPTVLEYSTYTAGPDSPRNVDIYHSTKAVVRIEFRAQTSAAVKALKLDDPLTIIKTDIVAVLDHCLRWQPFSEADNIRMQGWSPWRVRRNLHLVRGGYLHGRQWLGFSQLLAQLGLSRLQAGVLVSEPS